ncbi:MAG TPA: DNA recombination protein RmuC [Bacteroidales bacterium]|nr:DNA recombination protein RmuC [Bacteroidales bacterium]
MELIWIILPISLSLGGLAGYLIAQRSARKTQYQTLEELNLARQQLAEERGRAHAQASLVERESRMLKENLDRRELELGGLQGQIRSLSEEKSRLQAQGENLEQQLKRNAEEIARQEERLRNEFRALAQDILKKNSNELNEANREHLGHLLNPLRDQLERFEKKVQSSQEVGTERHTELKVELEKLRELNTRLKEEANNLTRALKGDSKKQGNWGEMVLERVLELSGLEKGREYEVQQTIRADGSTYRPDVVVSLPENKHIVIDSKVSLLHYEAWASAETEEERSAAVRQHLSSVRNHIRQLSDKSYQQGEGLDTPDFVLMFMPLEPAFSLAVREDPDLFGTAWERKIVIVSPTTLLATLRTVASIWKHEKQTQNALEIARQGGDLYDKFVSFLADLDGIGQQIERLRTTYDAATNKLHSGKGNLIRRVEKLRQLGAKAGKDIPERYRLADNAMEEDERREEV